MRRIILAAPLLASLASPCVADQTIDQLTSAGALAGTESVPIFQSANPAVKTTANAIAQLTSVATSCPASSATRGAITIFAGIPPSSVSTVTYTPANTNNYDCGLVVTLTNVSANTVTLPQAGAGGFTQNGWHTRYCSVAGATFNTTTSTFNPGALASLTLAANSCVDLESDAVNFWFQKLVNALQ